MARRPKIRASYDNDAQFLLRLADAIARDTMRPQAWRNQMADRVKALAIDFMQAPTEETEESAPARGQKKKRQAS